MYQPPEPPQFNPYAAPAAPLATPNQIVLQLASRVSRFGAAMLDGLLYFGLPVVGVALMATSSSGNEIEPNYIGLTMIVLGLLAVIAVNCVWLDKYGQSIGKRAVGIKVVQVDGSRCELWRFFFVRYLPIGVLGAIPGLGALLSLVNVLMIFGQEQRCLHDLFANTIVVQA
jgi:uncharacterized RDD family membrane protein YckC